MVFINLASKVDTTAGNKPLIIDPCVNDAKQKQANTYFGDAWDIRLQKITFLFSRQFFIFYKQTIYKLVILITRKL